MEYFADPGSTAEIEARLYKFFNLIFRRPSPTLANDPASFEKGDDEDTWPLPGRLRRVLLRARSPRRSDLLEAEEFEVYLRSFSQTWEEKGSGMQGPLSYYRTGQLRVEEEKGMDVSLIPSSVASSRTSTDLPSTLPATLPILFLQPLKDPMCPPSQVERMKKKFIPHVNIKPVDCGHWIMLEEPEAVSKLVLEWLSEIKVVPSRSHTSKL